MPKVLEKKIEMDALAEVFSNARLSDTSSRVNVDYDDDGWSSDSPPMPTCPPPAPPPEVLAGLLEETLHTVSLRKVHCQSECSCLVTNWEKPRLVIIQVSSSTNN